MDFDEIKVACFRKPTHSSIRIFDISFSAMQQSAVGAASRYTDAVAKMSVWWRSKYTLSAMC